MRNFDLISMQVDEKRLFAYDTRDGRTLQQSLLNTARAVRDKGRKYTTHATKQGIEVTRIA
jgi:hypothetical protein